MIVYRCSSTPGVVAALVYSSWSPLRAFNILNYLNLSLTAPDPFHTAGGGWEYTPQLEVLLGGGTTAENTSYLLRYGVSKRCDLRCRDTICNHQ